MLDMSRREDSDGKIQANSLEEIRAGLKAAAARIAMTVPRKGRPLAEGPVLSRLAAWFLVQDDATQAEIVRAGHKIIEGLKLDDKPGGPLDGEAAKKTRARFLTDDSPAGESKSLPSAVWNMRVPDERQVAEPAKDVGEGFGRDNPPVGESHGSPRRKRGS